MLVTVFFNVQFLYILVEYLYDEVPETTDVDAHESFDEVPNNNFHVLQLEWPDNRADQYKRRNSQSCKYLGEYVGITQLKVRLEVCRFLVSVSFF